VHKDSRAMYCAFLRDNAGGLQLAWRAQASGGRRHNINREGCVSNENDFGSSSVRLTTPPMADSPSGHGMAYGE